MNISDEVNVDKESTKQININSKNAINTEYEKLCELFGINDVLHENNAIKYVYSTALYLPMDLRGIDFKLSLYYTGLIKHMELFSYRVESPKDSLLFIYYDAMLDKYIESLDYKTNENDNEYNKIVKHNYKQNKIQIEYLLELYAIALLKIKKDRKKYKHIRLFSYDCKYLKKKRKFMGHPDVFGSIVRFIPIFNDNIEQTILINISHAITPRLARILTIFNELPKRIILSGFDGYKGQLHLYPYYDILNTYNVFNDLISLKNISQLLFGGCTSIKNRKFKVNGLYKELNFYNAIIKLINVQNDNPTLSIFKYGIDEIILTASLFIDAKNYMSLCQEPLKKYKTQLFSKPYDAYKLQQLSAKVIYSSIYYIQTNDNIKKVYDAMMETFVGNYRYWTRPIDNATLITNPGMFVQSRNSEDIQKFLGKVDNIDDKLFTSHLITLLYGFDEYKPIIINFSPDYKHSLHMYTDTFTVFNITESVSLLTDTIIKYMNDDTCVVKHPYKMSNSFISENFLEYFYMKSVIPLSVVNKMQMPRNNKTNKNANNLKKIKTKTSTLRTRLINNQ